MPGGVAGDKFTDTSQYPAWEYDVFRALGNFHPSAAQLRVMNVVAGNEGMPDNQNNWLAITESTPNEWGPTGVAKGASTISGPAKQVGVVQYKTHAQGVQAIADFLMHGHPDLLKLLRDPNATYNDLANAFISNGWPGDKAALAAAAKENGAFYVPSTSGEKTYSQSAPPNSGNGCSGKPDLIGFDTVIGHQTILSACAGKALLGGLMTGLGVAIMAGGIAIIIKNADQRLGLSDIAKEVAKPTTNLSNRLFGQTKESEPVTTQPPKRSPQTPPKAPKPTKQEQSLQRREAAAAEVQKEIDQRARENAARYGTKTAAPKTAPTPAKTPPKPAAPKVDTRVPRKEQKWRKKP